MKEMLTTKLKSKEIWGHPAGLYVLFFTEMWERFSFYGMKALLMLYMTKYLIIDPVRADQVIGFQWLQNFLNSMYGEMNVQQTSSIIYGWYTGFVYFTPFFGGILADKYLGQRKSVYLGGLLMAIGHFLMAYENMFLIAILFLILGNGAFKPNISTQVGNLYKEGDSRRDSAFTIFYMGINLGAMFSPLICGTLGQLVGWHWGFGAAGVGMLIGLIFYWLGENLVPRDDHKLQLNLESTTKTKLSKEEYFSVFALLFLCFLNITFWAIYEQQGNTLQLWADEKTNWNLLGFTIPSTWFQSFNPLMIILFAPLLSSFWNKRAKVGKESSSVTKMGIGSIYCGLAYLVMILAARFNPEADKGNIMWLVGTVFIFTLGELYLSPIGLSLVTKVAPAPILSMMMGAWFLSSFFGNNLAGYLGIYYSKMSPENFFLMLAAFGIANGTLFFIAKKPLEKIIGKSI